MFKLKNYLIISLLLIFLLPGLVALTIHKQIGINQEKENHVIYFYGDKSYQFNFISPKERINSLSLKLKNQLIRNKEAVTFTIISNNDKRELLLNGSNIGDGDWTRFSFPEITNSQDLQLQIKLISLTSTQSNAIGVMVDENDQPAIITYHRVPSYYQLILSIYQNLFKKMLQDPLFTALWSILFILLSYHALKPNHSDKY